MITLLSNLAAVLNQLFPNASSLLTLAGLTAFDMAGVQLFKYWYSKYATVRHLLSTDPANTVLYVASIFFAALGVAIAALATQRYDTATILIGIALIHTVSTTVYSTFHYTVVPAIKNANPISTSQS